MVLSKGAGEAHGGRAGGPGARDGDLVARDVELATARGSGGVEGERLGAEQVVSRGDVGGDLDVHLAAAAVVTGLLDSLFDTPGALDAFKVVLRQPRGA